ncbi:MAG: class I SAM-dependent methyltransferase [Flammeovirgaceae bacterium]
MFYTFQQFIRHWWLAKDEHSIHSPFVFDFYTKIVQSQKWFYIFDEIEDLRNQLLQNNNKLELIDFGAGSQHSKSNIKTISQIAQYSISSPKVSRFLFRLIDELKPKIIFELGTCLGINTIYMASAFHQSKITTFEGSPSLCTIARQNFSKFPIPTINLVEGNINETLKNQLSQHQNIDLVFFDANHRYKPTIKYFNECLEKVHEDSIFIFDDIYWSKEMTKAWKEIQNHPSVRITIDLFQIGLVFFRKKQAKEHFYLKF